MSRGHQVGREGEARAADFLKAEGYELLARNLRYRVGEIDLVAWRQGTLVFVEVKARSRSRWDVAFSVDRRKRAHLVRAANWALARNPDWLRRSEEVRFDLVVVERGGLVEHATGFFAL